MHTTYCDKTDVYQVLNALSHFPRVSSKQQVLTAENTENICEGIVGKFGIICTIQYGSS